MKKKLTALLIFFAMATNFAFPAMADAAALMSNPFAVQDQLRRQVLSKVSQAYSGASKRSAEGESGTEEGTAASSPNRYIVKFKNGALFYDIYQCVSNYQYRMLGSSKSRMFLLTLSDPAGFKNTYANIVEMMTKDEKRKTNAIPNDTHYPQQWAIPAINLPEAWNITKGSTAIKVAVIDTGFNRNHTDFNQNKILNGYDFLKKSSAVTTDETGHGTAVASIIAAATNNKKGIAGGCWNVTIVPFKAGNNKGDFDDSDIVNAIYMAADAGCDVINMSFGGYFQDCAFDRATEYVATKGCILVASSGNEGAEDDPECGEYCYPASCEDVISVGSVNSNLARADFSQYNDKVDVTAPGTGIYLASNKSNDSFDTEDGTSLSAPYVSAVAALAKSVNKHMNSDEFETLIKRTSTDLGYSSKDDEFGWGLINAYELVKSASLPIVFGVDNNGVYSDAREITFNHATAKLNGQPFLSGTTINEDGEYTLVVTGENGSSITICFTIQKDPLVVSGIENNMKYNTDRTITFNHGSAKLNGNPFKSGQTVSEEGDYSLEITDAFENSEDFTFTIDKTPPKVVGVENGGIYEKSVTITFNEGSATLNGGYFKSGYDVSSNGSYTLVVTDEAGNNTTVSFQMKNCDSNKLKVNQNLGKWVSDDKRNLLYAISSDGNSLIFINTQTLNIERSISLPGTPSDITLDGDKLYISLKTGNFQSDNQIAIVDIISRSIERSISTQGVPMNIVKDGHFLFYSQYYGSVFQYNLLDNTNTQLEIQAADSSDLAVNHDKHILYIGESGEYDGNLYYYDITRQKLIGKAPLSHGDGYFSCRECTIFDGKYVFFDGRVFDPENPCHIEGDFGFSDSSPFFIHEDGENIICAKQGFVFARKKGNIDIFDENTDIMLGQVPDSYLIEASGDGAVFTYDGTYIYKHVCDGGHLSKSNILSVLSGTSTKSPAPVSSSQVTQVSKQLTLPSNLQKWVFDNQSNTLLAISKDERALYFINGKTLNATSVMTFKGSPTDLFLENGTLYVALSDCYKILEIDIKRKFIQNTFYAAASPNSVVKDGDNLFYSDQTGKYSIHKLNMLTGDDQNIMNADSPLNIAINKKAHILYIAKNTGGDLTLYSTIQDSIINTISFSTGRSGYFGHDDSHFYYTGKAFDINNIQHILGDYDGYLINIAGNFAFTQSYDKKTTFIYNKNTFQKICECPIYADLIEASDSGTLFFYNDSTKTIKSFMSKSGTITQNNIINILSGKPVLNCPVFSNTVDASTKALRLGSDISDWALDDNTNTLYAISKKHRALYLIDAKTFDLERTINLNGEPTDIICNDGKLYIALGSIRQITVFDNKKGSFEKIYYTTGNPYSFVISKNEIYYTTYEWNQFPDPNKDSSIYALDMNCGTDKLIISKINCSNIAVNSKLNILYIGDSYNYTNDLIYYDIAADKIIDKNALGDIWHKNILFDGSYVYFNGRGYMPDKISLVDLSYDSSDVIFSKNGYVFTENGIYEKETHKLIKSYDFKTELVEMSQDGTLYFYNQQNKSMHQINNANMPLSGLGIKDGGVYDYALKVEFNHATALLNNSSYSSGELIQADGEYTLIIKNDDGTQAYHFTIDQNAPVITAHNQAAAEVENGAFTNNNVTVNITDINLIEKTVLRNGSAISWPSDNTFSEDGNYIITAKDKAGHITTFSFTIDKTPPKIITQSIIKKGSVIYSVFLNYFEPNILSVKLTWNKRDMNWPLNKRLTLPGTYKATIVDKAGNESTYIFRVH